MGFPHTLETLQAERRPETCRNLFKKHWKCDLEGKVRFSAGGWQDTGGRGLWGRHQTVLWIPDIHKPWAVPSCPSFALFPVNGVNSSASVQPLWGEDNASREKSVQYCFIFMPHPDRKISFILCNTFVILVWINARLWENADTSCQRQTVYNCPSLLSWGIFIIIFSASQRDEQNSCSEYKAEIERAASTLTFTVEANSVCVEILMTSGPYFLGQEVLLFFHFTVCHYTRACLKT